MDKIFTLGIDIGSSNIKMVLVEYSENPMIIDKESEKIRKRNPEVVSDLLMDSLLSRNNLTFKDITYVATTGEGEMFTRKRGHFYSMTTHARGGIYFLPKSKTVIDLGALYVRAIRVNEKGKVIDYKMTGQCASGSGQFVENISRYLGLAVEEVGATSLKSMHPELPSGICAVLAETDVINMVSRGISTADIIKGIHLSIANKVVKLLTSVKAESPVCLTGGMAMNVGMVQAIKEIVDAGKLGLEINADPNAIYAGALGAALWGGFRHYKLLK